MPLQELKYESIWVAVGVLASASLDYVIQHPATAISTVIMMLVAWERYRRSRWKTKEQKAKALKAEKEEYLIQQKMIDWEQRFQDYKREEEEIKRKKDGPEED